MRIENDFTEDAESDFEPFNNKKNKSNRSSNRSIKSEEQKISKLPKVYSEAELKTNLIRFSIKNFKKILRHKVRDKKFDPSSLKNRIEL